MTVSGRVHVCVYMCVFITLFHFSILGKGMHMLWWDSLQFEMVTLIVLRMVSI